MTRYKNRNGDSGIYAYELAADSIIIRFKKRRDISLCNLDQPGLNHVRRMADLAVSGAGLATYINKYVRDNYADKLR